MTADEAGELLEECHLEHWENVVYAEHKWTWTKDRKVVATATKWDVVNVFDGLMWHEFRGQDAMSWTALEYCKSISKVKDTTMEPDEDE